MVQKRRPSGQKRKATQSSVNSHQSPRAGRDTGSGHTSHHAHDTSSPSPTHASSARAVSPSPSASAHLRVAASSALVLKDQAQDQAAPKVRKKRKTEAERLADEAMAFEAPARASAHDDSDEKQVPARRSSSSDDSPGFVRLETPFRDQNGSVIHEQIHIHFDPERFTVLDANIAEVLPGKRGAAIFTVRDEESGTSYKVATAHAPYDGASGVARQYFEKLMAVATKQGCDVIMGDLNLYAPEHGASGRAQRGDAAKWVELETPPTSSGGSRLDRILVRSGAGLEDAASGAALKPLETSELSFNLVSWNMQKRGHVNERSIPPMMSSGNWDVLIGLEPNTWVDPSAAQRRARPRRQAVADSETKQLADAPPDHDPIFVSLPLPQATHHDVPSSAQAPSAAAAAAPKPDRGTSMDDGDNE